jgi:hypothetical protein
MPSKALLRPYVALAEAQRIPGAREAVTGALDVLRRPGAAILIGCTIIGSEVADFLHAAAIAVVGELPLERLRLSLSGAGRRLTTHRATGIHPRHRAARGRPVGLMSTA